MTPSSWAVPLYLPVPFLHTPETVHSIIAICACALEDTAVEAESCVMCSLQPSIIPYTMEVLSTRLLGEQTRCIGY